MKNLYLNFKDSKEGSSASEIKIETNGLGEVQIVDFKPSDESFRIFTRLNSLEDLGNLELLVQYIRNNSASDWIELKVPYIPGITPMGLGMSNSGVTTSFYAEKLITMKLNNITTFDTKLGDNIIPNLKNVTPDEFIYDTLIKLSEDKKGDSDFMFVSPMASQLTHTVRVANASCDSMGLTPKNHEEYIVKCDKVYAPITNKMTGFEILSGKIKGFDAIVICGVMDVAKEYIDLANLLKKEGAKSVTLLASHGNFKKDMTNMTAVYDKIVATNSFISSKDTDKFINVNVLDFI